MGSTEKSLTRKLRRLYAQLPGWTNERAYTENIFRVGRFASKLFPYWMESEYTDLHLYLYHRCGLSWRDAGKITIWAETYYEIPSLSIWQEVGWRQAAAAASRNQEAQREYLLSLGLNVLDLMTMV